MSNITKEQVIEWLSSQSVLELAALVKDLEGKWGEFENRQIGRAHV